MASASYVNYLFGVEQQVIETFRLPQAVTPDSAIVPPAWSARAQRQIFARFARKRALVSVGDGRYYLDEARWAEYSKARWRPFVILLVIGLVVFIGALVLNP